ncbi:hypothetical protein SVIO_028720 [Streptomyces violaceusniger]|uniref:Uncharacterized protein n=1 Tax=Streptomyces violaceusniger TaxID=68280 RepID=A0A4D4L2H8_STRVO|nr:hypothetical protein SVIO_028720 [Streptomyces violaceusniger]
MYGRFGSAALLSLLRDPAHHVAKSGHLLPSQSFRLRALNRVDTELETHIPTASGATPTVTRSAPAHRITIIGHNHQPARTSAPGPDSNRKASPKSEPVPGLVDLRAVPLTAGPHCAQHVGPEGHSRP